MAGKPGRSGRQVDRPFAEALKIAVKRVHDGDPGGRVKLAIIAEKLVEQAIDGEMEAIKEVSNRLDGKPAQAMELTGQEGGPLQIEIRKLFRPVVDGDSEA